MLCCGPSQVSKPTPSAQLSASSSVVSPAAVVNPPAPKFQPNKITRPESAGLEQPRKRTGSALGVKAPLFTADEQEQLFVGKRFLELKKEFQIMGQELTDDEIREIARADVRKVQLSRNVINTASNEGGEDDEDGEDLSLEELEDDALVRQLRQREQKYNERFQLVQKQPSEVEKMIISKNQTIHELNDYTRSDEEKQLAELLGETEPARDERPAANQQQSVVLGDITID